MAAYESTGASSAHLPPPLEYQHVPWGELITGTEEQLRELGIGVGRDFPNCGRFIKFGTDPRGMPVELQHDRPESGTYTARIVIPGARKDRYERPPAEAFADGVTVRRCRSGDEYRGTREALAAAGLAEAWQFPGQPGMRKVCVTIFDDGTVYSGPRGSNPKAGGKVAKVITAKGPRRFTVDLYLSEAEKEVRRKRAEAFSQDVEAHNSRLPRPAPLISPGTVKATFAKTIEGRGTRLFSSDESEKQFLVECIQEQQETAALYGTLSRRPLEELGGMYLDEKKDLAEAAGVLIDRYIEKLAAIEARAAQAINGEPPSLQFLRQMLERRAAH
jgi:hypothetical protein